MALRCWDTTFWSQTFMPELKIESAYSTTNIFDVNMMRTLFRIE